MKLKYKIYGLFIKIYAQLFNKSYKIKWSVFKLNKDLIEIRAEVNNLPFNQRLILRSGINNGSKLNKFMSQTKVIRKNMRKALHKKIYFKNNSSRG